MLLGLAWDSRSFSRGIIPDNRDTFSGPPAGAHGYGLAGQGRGFFDMHQQTPQTNEAFLDQETAQERQKRVGREDLERRIASAKRKSAPRPPDVGAARVHSPDVGRAMDEETKFLRRDIQALEDKEQRAIHQFKTQPMDADAYESYRMSDEVAQITLEQAKLANNVDEVLELMRKGIINEEVTVVEAYGVMKQALQLVATSSEWFDAHADLLNKVDKHYSEYGKNTSGDATALQGRKWLAKAKELWTTLIDAIRSTHMEQSCQSSLEKNMQLLRFVVTEKMAGKKAQNENEPFRQDIKEARSGIWRVIDALRRGRGYAEKDPTGYRNKAEHLQAAAAEAHLSFEVEHKLRRLDAFLRAAKPDTTQGDLLSVYREVEDVLKYGSVQHQNNTLRLMPARKHRPDGANETMMAGQDKFERAYLAANRDYHRDDSDRLGSLYPGVSGDGRSPLRRERVAQYTATGDLAGESMSSMARAREKARIIREPNQPVKILAKTKGSQMRDMSASPQDVLDAGTVMGRDQAAAYQRNYLRPGVDPQMTTDGNRYADLFDYERNTVAERHAALRPLQELEGMKHDVLPENADLVKILTALTQYEMGKLEERLLPPEVLQHAGFRLETAALKRDLVRGLIEHKANDDAQLELEAGLVEQINRERERLRRRFEDLTYKWGLKASSGMEMADADEARRIFTGREKSAPHYGARELRENLRRYDRTGVYTQRQKNFALGNRSRQSTRAGGAPDAKSRSAGAGSNVDRLLNNYAKIDPDMQHSFPLRQELKRVMLRDLYGDEGDDDARPLLKHLVYNHPPSMPRFMWYASSVTGPVAAPLNRVTREIVDESGRRVFKGNKTMKLLIDSSTLGSPLQPSGPGVGGSPHGNGVPFGGNQARPKAGSVPGKLGKPNWTTGGGGRGAGREGSGLTQPSMMSAGESMTADASASFTGDTSMEQSDFSQSAATPMTPGTPAGFGREADEGDTAMDDASAQTAGLTPSGSLGQGTERTLGAVSTPAGGMDTPGAVSTPPGGPASAAGNLEGGPAVESGQNSAGPRETPADRTRGSAGDANSNGGALFYSNPDEKISHVVPRRPRSTASTEKLKRHNRATACISRNHLQWTDSTSSESEQQHLHSTPTSEVKASSNSLKTSETGNMGGGRGSLGTLPSTTGIKSRSSPSKSKSITSSCNARDDHDVLSVAAAKRPERPRLGASSREQMRTISAQAAADQLLANDKQQPAGIASTDKKSVILLLLPPSSGKPFVTDIVKRHGAAPLVTCAGTDVVGQVVEHISSKMRESGSHTVLLQGFPATAEQARALDEALEDSRAKLGAVTRVWDLIDAAQEQMEKRVCGRWLHASSGRTYHAIYRPPRSFPAGGSVHDANPENMRDDVTGEPLQQREKDKPEAARALLASYRKTAADIVNYYRDINKRGTREVLLESVEVAQDSTALVRHVSKDG
ncbi:unnamed protein product [Amoebophrya sp. A25]|nr:unnamed protein product [Amoebophrya sp. A25]|eukprot:GSA25T00006148001.1